MKTEKAAWDEGSALTSSGTLPPPDPTKHPVMPVPQRTLRSGHGLHFMPQTALASGPPCAFPALRHS